MVGRIAGLAPSMAYSEPFKKALAGRVWTEALLNKWSEDPQNVAPDTVILYHQDDLEKRQAIIDFLKTLY
ncbi:MAG: hypothetical protein H7240_03115 [Glaciimonas sp.]|nr:hypothetical protein [Glaciimonas sp.]